MMEHPASQCAFMALANYQGDWDICMSDHRLEYAELGTTIKLVLQASHTCVNDSSAVILPGCAQSMKLGWGALPLDRPQ